MEEAGSILGLLAGAACISTALAWAMGGLVSYRRQRSDRSHRLARQRQQFQEQVLAAQRMAAASVKSLRGWRGERTFRVASIVEEARDCKSFFLVPADGRPLPRFEPGQFLTFVLRIPGREKPVVRCYSLSDRFREDYYRCTVKRIRTVRGDGTAHVGTASGYLHDAVRSGDSLELQAPAGSFFLNPTRREPIVMVAGGIGVTPLVSMLNALVYEGQTRTVYFFYGARNSAEFPLGHQLRELAASQADVHLDVSFSQPLTTDSPQQDYDHQGRVTIERLRCCLPSNNFRFYLCGPSEMMAELGKELMAWGVPREMVHCEAFGPASVPAIDKQAAPVGSVGAEIVFRHSQRQLTWDGNHPSLLDFAEAHELVLESGCRAGNCGQCAIPVADGRVQPLKESGFALPPRHCLACISVPDGPLVLDA